MPKVRKTEKESVLLAVLAVWELLATLLAMLAKRAAMQGGDVAPSRAANGTAAHAATPEGGAAPARAVRRARHIAQWSTSRPGSESH